MNEAKRKNILFAVIAVAVAIVFFFAGFGTGFGVGKGAADAPNAEAGVFTLPEETEQNGISLSSVQIKREAYEDYGISPIAENAYTVTATAKNGNGEDAIDAYQLFDFALSWSRASSYNVEEYIQLTTTDRTATLSLLKGFNVEIVLKATSRINPEKSANISCNYVRRPTGYTIYTRKTLEASSDELDDWIPNSINKGSSSSSSFRVGVAGMETKSFVSGAGSWNEAAVIFSYDLLYGDVGTMNDIVESFEIQLACDKDIVSYISGDLGFPNGFSSETYLFSGQIGSYAKVSQFDLFTKTITGMQESTLFGSSPTNIPFSTTYFDKFMHQYLAGRPGTDQYIKCTVTFEMLYTGTNTFTCGLQPYLLEYDVGSVQTNRDQINL